jgi:hypothetical protein
MSRIAPENGKRASKTLAPVFFLKETVFEEGEVGTRLRDSGGVPVSGFGRRGIVFGGIGREGCSGYEESKRIWDLAAWIRAKSLAVNSAFRQASRSRQARPLALLHPRGRILMRLPFHLGPLRHLLPVLDRKAESVGDPPP